MTQVYVAGIAMTVFGRHPERSLEDLAGEALSRALADAGCTAPQIGVAYYSGMTNGTLQGQISIPGQVVFSKIGIEGIPVYNVENACASAGEEEARFSMLAGKLLQTPPEDCAADIIAGVERGKRRIVTGHKSTSLYWLTRLMPNRYPALLKTIAG